MGRLIVNGKTSNDSPDESLVINRAARFRADNINGLITTGITINGLARPPVPSGCVLYAPLWHPALGGATFKTLDKNAHTGTVSGALWTPQGRKFDGNDDYVNFGDLDILDTFTTLSIMAWIKPTTVTSAGIIRKWSPNVAGAVDYPFLLSTVVSGALTVGIRGASSNSVSTSFAVADKWSHIGISLTYAVPTIVSLYLNGAFVETVSVANTGELAANTSNVVIGHHSVLTTHTATFNGIMGGVSVVKELLTAGDFMRDFQSTKWRHN